VKNQNYIQMNFIRTGPNSARCENVEVKIAKRDQLQYIDNSHTTTIPIEIGVDRVIGIATSQVPVVKRQEVKKGIDQAMNFLSIPHRFDA
jgi:hypothetical protein